VRRLHLFEWADQPWLPTLFRDFITDHIRYASEKLNFFQPIYPKLHESMRALDETRIVDLCSGAGGPLPGLMRHLESNFDFAPEVTLTDLYPNREAFRKIEEQYGGRIGCRYQPTSAFEVPPELSGFRTIFGALHHFRPRDATRILADAVENRVGIAAFEVQERSLVGILNAGLLAFLSSLLLTPKVGRLTVARFLLTYLLPLAPLVFAWDGIVSCLRTYSPSELGELIRDLRVDGYSWEIGRLRVEGVFTGYGITYAIGMPEPSEGTRSAEGG
jgi:hypothetical protein